MDRAMPERLRRRRIGGNSALVFIFSIPRIGCRVVERAAVRPGRNMSGARLAPDMFRKFFGYPRHAPRHPWMKNGDRGLFTFSAAIASSQLSACSWVSISVCWRYCRRVRQQALKRRSEPSKRRRQAILVYPYFLPLVAGMAAAPVWGFGGIGWGCAIVRVRGSCRKAPNNRGGNRHI